MGALSITRLGPHILCGIAFVTYAAISAISLGDKGAVALAWLATLVYAFIIGYRLESIRHVWLGAIILSIIVTFSSWATGLAINPNYLGIGLAISVAGAIAYSHLWALPFLIFGVWSTQSRTALIGTGIACLVGLWHWSRFWAMSLALIALLFILHQKSDGALSLWSRLGIWQDTIEHFTFFGNGYGSFFTEYSSWPVRRNMTLELAPHAYNDILELIFELGIGAVALWAMILYAWENNNPGDKLILIVFFSMSLTHFPASIPVVAQLFALTLGHLSNQRFERKYYGRMPSMAT